MDAANAGHRHEPVSRPRKIKKANTYLPGIRKLRIAMILCGDNPQPRIKPGYNLHLCEAAFLYDVATVSSKPYTLHIKKGQIYIFKYPYIYIYI